MPKPQTPAIRFAGFTEEWEQRKIKDVCSISTGKSNTQDNVKDGIYPFYVRSPIIERSNKYLFDEEAVLTVGDGVGTGKVFHYVNGKYDLHQRVYRMYGFSDEIIAKYFYYLFSEKFYNRVMMMTAKTSVDSVRYEMIADMDISIPCIEEQKQIATFFDFLDHLISLHQRKYTKLVSIKRSMLEKMFPKNGANVPEIRFEGFTGEWERRKLGEICSSFSYGLNVAAKEFDGKNKYIRITDIDDETRTFMDSDITSPDIDLTYADDYRLQEGDIVFARTGASVGKTFIYKETDGLVYYAGFLIRGRVRPEYSSEFVFQNTLTEQYSQFIRLTSQRSGQPGVNAQEYAEFKLFCPSYQEQEQIGRFFLELDSLIAQQQCKVEKLVRVKKSCLEKMFV
ncbi:MAG: restriction endonuclease subunit S [Oscillospiraceae bacterium]|nr:restriction endonuclease subunit S [Oscillospiraceae bacterium]